MRLILACTCAVCCAGLGVFSALRLDRRAAVTRVWANALRRMESAAAHLSLPLEDLLRYGAGDEVPALSRMADALSARPQMGAGALIPDRPPEMAPSEWREIDRCLSALDGENRLLQLEALRQARLFLTPLCRKAAADASRLKKARLAVGFLSGAALFILLC